MSLSSKDNLMVDNTAGNESGTGGSSGPLQIWTGHKNDVEQISWDPTGTLLASCSRDTYVCIWKPEQNQPVLTFDKFSCPINTIRWSNRGAESEANAEPLLAVGGQDGFIFIWNVN